MKVNCRIVGFEKNLKEAQLGLADILVPKICNLPTNEFSLRGNSTDFCFLLSTLMPSSTNAALSMLRRLHRVHVTVLILSKCDVNGTCLN